MAVPPVNFITPDIEDEQGQSAVKLKGAVQAANMRPDQAQMHDLAADEVPTTPKSNIYQSRVEVQTTALNHCPDCLKSCWGPDETLHAEVETLRMSVRKSMFFLLFVMVVYGVLAHLQAEPPEVPAASAYRALVQFVLAVNIALAMAVDLLGFPPPRTDSEVFALYQGAGRPYFLSFWILTIQLVYSIACFEAELGLFTGWEHHRLLALNYSSAVFVDTLGVVLTLFFVRFVYYEDNWRRDVMHYWEMRGKPWGPRSLVVHVLPLPVAVIDLLAKDATMKERYKPSYWQNATAAAAFTLLYVLWMFYWWYVGNYTAWWYVSGYRVNIQEWTLLSRLCFGLGAAAGICIVMLPMQFYL